MFLYFPVFPSVSSFVTLTAFYFVNKSEYFGGGGVESPYSVCTAGFQISLKS